MNTQNINTQNHNGTVEHQIGNAPPPGSTIQQFNGLARAQRVPRRPRGKIASLPKVVRIEVNGMLDDGCSYRAIAAKLQEMGYPGFFYQNIQRWKNGGYQEWVREQQECVRAVIHRLLENHRTV